MKNYILFELDEGISLPVSPYEWVKETPNVHKITYSWGEDERDFSYGSGGWGYGFYGSSGIDALPEPERAKVVKVGSLLVDSIVFTFVESISLCDSTSESFYFNISTQILYINFGEDTNPWDYTDISLGVSKGFSNRPVVFNGSAYDPRVLSIPSSVIKRDSLYYGQVSFSGGSVTLNNIDHYFDTFDQNDIFGKICRILYSEDNISYRYVYSGKLSDFKLSGDNFVLELKDPRESLKMDIPTEALSLENYPDIKESLIGTIIPVGYGPVLDSPAYSLNEESTGFFVFKFCLNPVTSISEIRVNNSEVAAYSINLAEGEFTLSSSDYSSGDEVTIDYFGKDITNPLEIIEDLLEQYTSIIYNDTFFNTTSWEVVKASIPQGLGLGLFEKEKLVDVIGRIAGSIRGSFIPDRDGRFNFKLVDNEKSPVLFVQAISYLQPPEVSTDFDEFLSTAEVFYNKGLTSADGPSFVDDSKDVSLFAKYDTRINKEFQSLLTSLSDAEELAEKFVNIFGGVFPYYKVKTKFETLDLEIEDLADFQMYVKDNIFYNVRLEILQQAVNFISREIITTGRFVLFTDQSGEVVDLPSGAQLLRRVKRTYSDNEQFPTDVIVKYNDIPDYIIQYSDDPDYILTYEE